LQRYDAAGIEGLLTVKQAPGRAAKIPADVIEQLQQRLATREGFHSYREIHQWLVQEHGVKVAYRTVHQLVHYTLKVKLKVPRPQSP
jgi:transposase